jgi:hypothetical protein
MAHPAATKTDVLSHLLSDSCMQVYLRLSVSQDGVQSAYVNALSAQKLFGGYIQIWFHDILIQYDQTTPPILKIVIFTFSTIRSCNQCMVRAFMVNYE